MELIFLGSGGGRWVTITQKKKTGGFRIHGSSNIHVDPGPGALVSLLEAKLSPLATDAVLVTHCHPDHYNDAEILIEAMTHGMTKNKGVIAGSESVLHGNANLGPAISKYHMTKLKEILTLSPGRAYKIHDLEFEALRTKHSDPSCVGLKFYYDEGTVSYTSDTEYYDGIEDEYDDTRVLILNVIRPRSDRIPWHLCADDALEMIKKIKPELAVMNHFGMKILGRETEEAHRIQRETGIKTIPAEDGLTVSILKNKIMLRRSQ